MFKIKEKLGGCCNSCSKTLNDNEKCITITTYWLDPLKYELEIMQMSLCEDCYKELAKEIKDRGNEDGINN